MPSEWIKCSERMPEVEDHEYYERDYSIPVLTNLSGVLREVFRFSYREKGWVFANLHEGPDPGDYEDYGLDRITLWMPLPEPPEESRE